MSTTAAPVPWASTSPWSVRGTDPSQLDELRTSRVDHNGLPVQPFTDTQGNWPLRCCLTDSRPGDTLAIVGWSPFPWSGAYAMTGPVVVHADTCWAPAPVTVPAQFDDRRQILRCYDADRLQVYDLAVLVEPGDGLEATLERLFSDERVEHVQSFNVLAGCWSFTAVRN